MALICLSLMISDIENLFKYLLATCVSCIFVLLVGYFTIYNGPKHSTDVPSILPKFKKARYALRRKHVLDKLRSGMNYSAGGHECNVNESTTYIQ